MLGTTDPMSACYPELYVCFRPIADIRRVTANLTPINDKIIHRANIASRGRMALMNDKHYFLRRAAEEVDAANRAITAEAKTAHLELAELYLLKIENGSSVLEATPPGPGMGEPFIGLVRSLS